MVRDEFVDGRSPRPWSLERCKRLVANVVLTIHKSAGVPSRAGQSPPKVPSGKSGSAGRRGVLQDIPGLTKDRFSNAGYPDALDYANTLRRNE